MWAIIEKEKNIVIGYLTPDTNIEDVKKFTNEYEVVLMTEENSPAWLGAKYINEKFYQLKEEING